MVAQDLGVDGLVGCPQCQWRLYQLLQLATACRKSNLKNQLQQQPANIMFMLLLLLLLPMLLMLSLRLTSFSPGESPACSESFACSHSQLTTAYFSM